MTKRGNIIAGTASAVVLIAAIVVLLTGDDPPLEDTRLGENTSSTTSTTDDADVNQGMPDGDAIVQGDLREADVALVEIATFDQPIASGLRAGEEGLYVAEREGRIFLLDTDGEKSEPLLDISDDTTTDSERGLLGMAFSPDGDRLYLDYTDGKGTTHLDEFAVSEDGVIDESSRREVLTVPQPYSNHNGGHIAFGPDGFLYIGLGDGGGARDPDGNGQDPSTLLGSILRIDPLDSSDGPYAVPDTNPFADGVVGAPEVYIYGIRNPWRFDFDAETGDLWIADVGQDEIEEIDYLPSGPSQAGLNLGWNVFEGSELFEPPAIDGTIKPVFEYTHDEGQSITGGVVYRGQALPNLIGAYLFDDYAAGRLRAISLDLSGCDDPCFEPKVDVERALGPEVPSVVHFAEGADGEVYVFSLEGTVSKIVPA